MPQISVLMPVYNGAVHGKERFLRLAIESILNQTFIDFEFVIINDGSHDHTQDILNEYAAKDHRIKLFRNDENIRLMRTLNKGIGLCQAPLIARMDSDDISMVTRLQVQKEFLDNRPETVLCGTGMFVIDEQNKIKMELYHPCNYNIVKDFLKKGCPFVHGSVMFRKAMVESVGGYSVDDRFIHAEDYELWVRLAAKFVVENIPDKALYYHRDHAHKISAHNAGQQAHATNIIAQIARDTL